MEGEPSVKLPEFEPSPGAESTFEFRIWQTWADPLGYANHPAYVDGCDEAIARDVLDAGIEPTLVRPVAERVDFRDSVLPGEVVRVRSRRIGVMNDAVVLRQELLTDRGQAARATTIRRLVDGADLAGAWD